NGDFETAIELLRKKGSKIAANRQDRDAKEGLVLAKISADKQHGVLVVVNCETDFVAKNEDFQQFANTVAQIALDKAPATIDALKALPYNSDITIADKFLEQMGKIGEKIDVSYFETINAGNVVGYNHPGNRLACLVGFSKEVSDEVSKNVAMQVASMNPVAVDKDGVDAKTLEKELEIAKETTRAEGKPEEMVEKIAMGKLNKFYKDFTLLNQEFIKDNKLTIRQYLEQTDKELKVTELKRFSLS
ncbi:MAG: elongation factor Ts, partial [Bacteroidia bacterium]|nr:elongation factor Ts [Bacteroidia bacterium]